MFKKALLAIVFALTMLSAVSVEGAAPPPTCHPCPWVK